LAVAAISIAPGVGLTLKGLSYIDAFCHHAGMVPSVIVPLLPPSHAEIPPRAQPSREWAACDF
jgi:hypothetical protein